MSGNDSEWEQVKRQQFVNDLMGFHAAVGTPLTRLPTVNGRQVDLLGLYEAVTRLGGWERVSDNDQWSEVVEALHFPAACVNNSVALKQIYLRVLDRYEKTHFVHKSARGEPEDEVEFNIRRMNKLSARALYTIPTTYNVDQHCLTEEQRGLLGLSALADPDRFDKLLLSLISPLPNEQDFAINVVALLSVHSLDNPVAFSRSHRLLVHLLAHAGVFPDPQLRSLLTEQYERDRGHPLGTFWRDSLRHDALAWLTSERNFLPSQPDGDCLMADVPDASYAAQHFNDAAFIVERVCQIGRILLNLMAHADNASYLASNLTAVRFVLLCCDCQYKKIAEIGWDLLNCVAGRMCLQSLGLKEVTLLVLEGIGSEDISEVLSALRVLAELTKVDSNQRTLSECLDQEMFSRLCTHLTLQDVVIILYTLEALYALSSSNKLFCESIAQATGSLSVLVLLLKFRVPLAANFGTWKSIRISETIMSEDGSRRLAEKNLGSVAVRPPELLHYPALSGGSRVVEPPPPCCAAGDCRVAVEKVAEAPPKDVVTLTNTLPAPAPAGPAPSLPPPSSLLSNALRNGIPNGLKPIAVSTVGPAVTLKCHLEEPVTKIVKISNPGNPSLLKQRSLGVAPDSNGTDLAESDKSKSTDSPVTASNHFDVPKSNGENPTERVGHVTNGLGVEVEEEEEEVKMNGEKEPDDYLCEWRGCLRKFKTPDGVLGHICTAHCPETMEEGKCLWGNCSAGKMVYRFLVKHIQREHCQQGAMLPIRARVALRPKPNPLEARGQPAVVPPPPPSPAPPPPPPPLMMATAPEPFLPPPRLSGAPPLPLPPHLQHHHYPPPQQPPPPQTVRYYPPPYLAHTPAGEKIAESVRLTSALVLRNVAASCPTARRRLLLYEPQIVEAAALDSEASRAAAECLSYLWT